VSCALTRNSERRIEIVDASPVFQFAAFGKDCDFRTHGCSGSIDEPRVFVDDRGIAHGVIVVRMLANDIMAQ
jgi:hypothetical protein